VKLQHLALFLGALHSGTTLAGPSDYVYTPQVEHGEREVDLKFGSARDGSGDRQQAWSIGYGYGASERWFSEIYAKFQSASGEGNHLDAWEWENKFQLTDTGEYPIDIGFLTEIEKPHRKGEPSYEFKFGPLFQTEFGKLQLNANLLWERKFRGSDEDPSVRHNTEFGYQWQVKYRWRQAFEFGLQGFGELGKWNDWDPRDQQNHRFGPAVFGKLALGNRQAVKYNAAWLVGVSQAAPDHTFRLQLEYEY
jgi:hypothetical protein